MTFQNKPNWLKLMLAIALCEGAGGLGALFTASALREWYPQLVKPMWNPPNWIFGPVWTILYAVMGVSLFLIWSQTPLERAGKLALVWFSIQLTLNVLWAAAFFGFRSEAWGYVVICLLWLAILGCFWTFGRVSKTAALLFLPYFLWVTFASCLNWSVFALNVVKPKTEQLEKDEKVWLKKNPQVR